MVFYIILFWIVPLILLALIGTAIGIINLILDRREIKRINNMMKRW